LHNIRDTCISRLSLSASVRVMNEVAVLSQSEIERIVETVVQKAVSKITPQHFPVIMTKKQVAEYLGRPVSTINRWMLEGMPFKKEGNEHPEFYRPDVDKWIAARFETVQSEVVQ
jgi:hypothetical protein